MPSEVHVINHPLVQHKLSLMRMKSTSTSAFRNLLGEMSLLLAYEVTRDLPTIRRPSTRRSPARAPPCSTARRSCSSPSCARATAFSTACCGSCRAHGSVTSGSIATPRRLVAVEYYFKVPQDMADRDAIVVDPMLATGNSAVAAVGRLKDSAPAVDQVRLPADVPRGAPTFHAHHPDVPVYTAAIDSHLNDHGYIVPGLGDAGDRLFGTK